MENILPYAVIHGWTLVVSGHCGVYVFAVFDWPNAVVIMLTGLSVFFMGHMVLVSMLRDYYEAAADVAKGWRISKNHKVHESKK